MRKTYLAIVRGVVAREHTTLTRAIGRHPTERKRMSVVSHAPRAAVSQVTTLARFTGTAREDGAATLVRVQPETGRTHQIRVHLASMGHPCLGDHLYGRGTDNVTPSFRRQALHALALSILHPRSGERLDFVAPLPEDFKQFFSARGLPVTSETLRGWIDSK